MTATAPSRPTGPGRALRARISAPATGAVTAQGTQAIASLLLQLVALRVLGAEGLGVFALLYGGVVLLTALTSGLVGDPLTVLQRADPLVRSGLAAVAAAALLGAAVLAAGGTAWSGLGVQLAMLAGLAALLFAVEDLLRRVLMADLRFWAVVVVDVVCAVATAGWVAAALLTRDLRLVDLVAAVAWGQGAAAVAGLLLVRRHGLPLGRPRAAGARVVLAYGLWRAGQQGLRASSLPAMRVVVVLAFGAAVFGQLEAARLFAAPALLLITGAASFLFASYARDRDVIPRLAVRRADRGVAVLLAITAALTAVSLALLPVLGPLLSGGEFTVDARAVLGWAGYAAAVAAVMPYASLAAVRGRHVAVLWLRAGELMASLAVLAGVLLLLDAPAWSAPYVLAAGGLLCAAAARRLVQRLPAAPEGERSGVGGR